MFYTNVLYKINAAVGVSVLSFSNCFGVSILNDVSVVLSITNTSWSILGYYLNREEKRIYKKTFAIYIAGPRQNGSREGWQVRAVRRQYYWGVQGTSPTKEDSPILEIQAVA